MYLGLLLARGGDDVLGDEVHNAVLRGDQGGLHGLADAGRACGEERGQRRTEGQRGRETEGQRDRGAERQRGTERQRGRETAGQRGTERQTEKQRDSSCVCECERACQSESD
jgi:hypothetical protein